MLDIKKEIAKITDPNNTEHVFLKSDRDELLEFEQVAFIPLENGTFVILAPIKGNPYYYEDNPVAFTFEMNLKENTIQIVRDITTIERVEKEYHKILYGNKKRGF